jgi:hypothetical protein
MSTSDFAPIIANCTCFSTFLRVAVRRKPTSFFNSSLAEALQEPLFKVFLKHPALLEIANILVDFRD